MTQLAAYWPIRQQINVPFVQTFTFLTSTGGPVNVSAYAWSLVGYDSPDTMAVVVPSSAFAFAVSGAGQNVLTATAAASLVPGGAVLYYELVGTPSGGSAQPLQHGPLVFEP